MFSTNLHIDDKTRIIALSDIHGDIDALIIALRDCAQVISNHQSHKLLLDTLHLDLNKEEDAIKYKGTENLGFEWSGDNTHVVLIGDTIDNIRPEHTPYIINRKTGKIII